MRSGIGVLVLVSALCAPLAGCDDHTVTRGGVIEVTFWTKDADAQSRVAVDCALTFISRTAAEHVRYAFTGGSTQPLTCLRRQGLVRATAQPL